MLAQLQNVDETVIQYATATDFCKIFTEEMHSLYLLSFLLTADKDKAEQCFIGALGECVEGNWRVHGVVASVGTARDYEAGHSDDETCAGRHGSLVAHER